MEHGENQVEEIRPCLIGGFRVKNAPTYADPVAVDAHGRVVSVDMVRIKVAFPSVELGNELANKASLLPSTNDGGYRSYTSQLLPGRYRVLSTYEMGNSSVVLGIGLVSGSGKLDMQQGFVEFNPNKVAQPACETVFHRFCARVGNYVKGAELMRWDLAYDVPIGRGKLRVEKDRRHYRLEQGSALTEYLGMRNAPGYVKVYDKAAELGLEGVDLTRIELTCSGKWTLEQISEHWPTVYGVRSSYEGLSNTHRLLVGLLADKVRGGCSVEPELKSLNKHTRQKVRAALEDVALVSFPRPAVAQAMSVADGWCRYFAA